MKRFATTLCGLLVLALSAMPAAAQLPGGAACGPIEDVTIDALNAVPQANIDQIKALGSDATAAQIHELLTNEYDSRRLPSGTPYRCVRVTGVVLSDPHYSGLASMVNAGGVWIPGRIHFYIRDINADPANPAGMTIMVVDGTRSGNSLNFRVGDVIELEAWLDIFGNPPERAWQLVPINAAAVGNVVIDNLEHDDPLLDPVVVTTNDINSVVATVSGEPVVQANWDNFNALNGQYVRVEGAVISNSQQALRPNWAFNTAGQQARVGSRDLSLRYRNDRIGSGDGCPGSSCYPNPPFFTRATDDPFVPPPPGAIVNVQGFLAFGAFDAFNLGQPPRAFWFLAPITDDDFTIAESPPIISVLALPGIPNGPFVVTAEVLAASGDPLTQVMLHYEFSTGSEGTIAMAEATGENRFAATVPVTEAEEGAFVSYFVSAADGGGLTNESSSRTTRVLPDGITKLAHIQETASGGHGPSPFAGLTTPMDLNVIVMTEPSESGFLSVQDGTGPWSGVFIVPTEELLALVERGMKLRITRAQIEENFGLTRLRLTSGNYAVDGVTTPHPYVTGISTAEFTNRDFAARYQGMALRFDNVIVTNPNADAPADFGEWFFSSDGTTASQIRADDESPNVPFGSSMFQAGDQLEFLQGIWTFTFSNYKLLPESLADISVSGEVGPTARSFQIDGAYPNPMSRQGTVAYTLDQPGYVTVEVYDVLGRRVAVLTDELQGVGQHRASIDAGSLSSGLYILRLTMGNEMQSARFIVTR